MTGFYPKEYSDNALIGAISDLRRYCLPHLGTWPQKRLAILEREANRRNLKLPKHTIQKP